MSRLQGVRMRDAEGRGPDRPDAWAEGVSKKAQRRSRGLSLPDEGDDML